MLPIRNCTSCNSPLKGRSDKRFCNDYCRNNFNNKRKAEDESTILIRAINRTLTKNRRIIATLLEEHENRTVPQDRLLILGFLFNYHTHLHTTKNGNTYYFNYEYGYLPLENNMVLLVRETHPRSG